VGFHDYTVFPLFAFPTSSTGGAVYAAVQPPNAESMATAPVIQSHGEMPPGSPLPPGPPSFLMFQGGDPARFIHAQHDFSAKPPLDEASLDSTSDRSQDDEVTIPPEVGQATAQVQGSSSIGQIAPVYIVAPGNLTALFKPAAEHDSQMIPMARSGETQGKQPVEAVSVNFSTLASGNATTTDNSIAGGSAHQGDDMAAELVETKLSGNQTKLLLPQAAGLISNAIPFDQAVLEKAVDQFFDELESLGMSQFVEPARTRLIPLSLALLGTVTAVEVARRRLKSRNGEDKVAECPDPLAGEQLLGFPELPGSWSTNLT
jgi:hypothetical protein